MDYTKLSQQELEEILAHWAIEYVCEKKYKGIHQDTNHQLALTKIDLVFNELESRGIDTYEVVQRMKRTPSFLMEGGRLFNPFVGM